MKKLFSALILSILILGVTITLSSGRLNIAGNIICLGILLILAITDAIIVHNITKEIENEDKK